MSSDDVYYACPSCKTNLEKRKIYFLCNECSIKYPVIWDSVPILLKDFKKYLLEYNLSLEHFLQKEYRQNQHLIKIIEDGHSRSAFLMKLLKSRLTNLKLINKLSSDIKSIIPENTILKQKPRNENQKFGYQPKINFNYLRRDWAKEDYTEAEIDLIKKEIFNAISFANKSPDQITVVGAATSRIAYEIALNSKAKVYAFDKSLLFGFLFNTLLISGIDFCDISTKNRITKEDAIRAFKLPPLQPLENLHYSISDATNLPFANNETSIIISLFFTDVIPLDYWIKEIHRTLPKGGLFVHLGPLDYHFAELEYQYSVKEIKDQFIENGFEIIYENFVQMPHLNHGDKHLFMKVYNSFSFTARKV